LPWHAEVECLPEEADAVQKALALILQRDGRINATCFEAGRVWERNHNAEVF
jgi:hypothetical protein